MGACSPSRDSWAAWQQSRATVTLSVFAVSRARSSDSSIEVMPRKSSSVDSPKSVGTMYCNATGGRAIRS